MSATVPQEQKTENKLAQWLTAVWEPLRRELFPLVWAVMDVALLTPLALSLMRWARYWPAGEVMWLLLLLMLLPYNLVRLMSLRQWPKPQQQRLLTAVLLLILFITLRTLLHHTDSLFDFSWLSHFYANLSQSRSNIWTRDATLFLLIIFTWWRGQALIDRQPDINRIGLKLRLGGLLLTPLIIWLATIRLLWSMTPFVLLYFLAALTAVSLVRAEQIEQERTGLSASLTPGWMGSIFIASSLVTLTSACFTFLASGNTPFRLYRWLAPLWDALTQLGTVAFLTASYIAFPLLQLFGIILEFLARLIAFVATPLLTLLQGVTGDPQPLADPTPILTFNDFVELTNQLNPGVKLGLLFIPLGIVLLISLFLGRLSQRRLATRNSQPLTHKTAVSEPEDDLTLGQKLLKRLGMLRNWRTALSIRRIYHQMCRAAAGAGYPRTTTQTPYEYLNQLAQVWPNGRTQTELVTQAYVRVRYGELPENKAELDAIRAAWEQLERTPPHSREETAPQPHLKQKSNI